MRKRNEKLKYSQNYSVFSSYFASNLTVGWILRIKINIATILLQEGSKTVLLVEFPASETRMLENAKMCK